MTQHSAGAVKAADIIGKSIVKCDVYSLRQVSSSLAKIIDRETHCAEMLAFIEKVAEFAFEGNKNLYDKVIQAQAEAFEILKKVRDL